MLIRPPVFANKSLLGRGSERHTSSLTCHLIIFYVIELNTLYTFRLLWLLCVTGKNSHSHSFKQSGTFWPVETEPQRRGGLPGVPHSAAPAAFPGILLTLSLVSRRLAPMADLCTLGGQSRKGASGEAARSPRAPEPTPGPGSCVRGQRWRRR